MIVRATDSRSAKTFRICNDCVRFISYTKIVPESEKTVNNALKCENCLQKRWGISTSQLKR